MKWKKKKFLGYLGDIKKIRNGFIDSALACFVLWYQGQDTHGLIITSSRSLGPRVIDPSGCSDLHLSSQRETDLWTCITEQGPDMTNASGKQKQSIGLFCFSPSLLPHIPSSKESRLMLQTLQLSCQNWSGDPSLLPTGLLSSQDFGREGGFHYGLCLLFYLTQEVTFNVVILLAMYLFLCNDIF